MTIFWGTAIFAAGFYIGLVVMCALSLNRVDSSERPTKPTE